MLVSQTTVHRIPVLNDNYVWLIVYADGKGAVVDPAEAVPVLACAETQGVRITHILNTHWHGDHVGGNLAIKEATGAQIVGPAREATRIPGLDHAVDEGDEVALGELRARVLFVGAHTAGHIAYWFDEAGLLFPGDTLFAMGCGRLFEGTADDMFRAMGKLQKLPPNTQVFCAHEYTLSNGLFAVMAEPDNQAITERLAQVKQLRERNQPTVPFFLQEELDTNPFLRARTAEDLGNLRARKDSFRAA